LQKCDVAASSAAAIESSAVERVRVTTPKGETLNGDNKFFDNAT
jgi:hypothetical protein